MVEAVLEAGGANFREVRRVGPETIADIQAQVRRRLLRALARRGLLEREDAEAMDARDPGGGFAFDAGVRHPTGYAPPLLLNHV